MGVSFEVGDVVRRIVILTIIAAAVQATALDARFQDQKAASECPTVTAWELYNADDDTAIRNLTMYDVVCVNETQHINLRAVLSGHADKVYWELSEMVVRTESSQPWFIGGHNREDVLSWDYTVGNQDIDLIIQVNDSNCTQEETIKFDVVQQCDCPNVLAWELYNADNDTAIRNLTMGDLVCLNEIDSNSINLRAVFSKSVDMVIFENFDEIVRTENAAPWFIGGNNDNDVLNWNYSVGDQDIDVIANVNGHNCTVEHTIMFTIQQTC